MNNDYHCSLSHCSLFIVFMPRVRIVTDSTAHFHDPDFPRRHHVAIVPLTIYFGRESFREGVDISSEQFFARLDGSPTLPTAASPAPETFTAVYDELAQSGDSIVSIHLSSKLGSVWRNAKAGSEPLLGRCNVQVIDSLSASVGLGLLVEAAVRAAEAGEPSDEVVRIVRGLVPRLYIEFFVESLDYLAHNKLFGRAQAVLGSMLGILPMLAVEDGDIVPMEKVRTRQQAVEQLMEFVSEFSRLEHLAILQNTAELTDESRQMINQLAVAFPGRQFPVEVYSPALGTFLGPNSMGVVVFEGTPDAD